MFCPVCKSEYREGYVRCADCDVSLVDSLRDEAEPLDHAALACVWEGSDAHENSQVRDAIERERIPFRVQKARPNVLGLSNQTAEAIYVPHAMVEQARAAILETIGDEIGDDETAGESTRPPSLHEPSETDPELPIPENGSWDPEGWHPEDATSKIWGNSAGTGSDAIIVSLEENRIHWRANDPEYEANEAITEIYVMPEDEERAREIIREVTEATPPQ